MARGIITLNTQEGVLTFEKIGKWYNVPAQGDKKRKYGLYYQLDKDKDQMTGCYMFANDKDIFYVGKTDEGFMKRFEHYACLSPKAGSTNADVHRKIHSKLNNGEDVYIYACSPKGLTARKIEIIATGYCYKDGVMWNL